jgi:hypothetical protein
MQATIDLCVGNGILAISNIALTIISSKKGGWVFKKKVG